MTTIPLHLFSCISFPLILLILLSSSLIPSSSVSLFFMLSFIVISFSLGNGTSSTKPCATGDDRNMLFPCFSLVYEMDNTTIICKERVDYDGYSDESDDVNDTNHGYDYDGCEGDHEDYNIETEEAYSSEDDENHSKDLEKRTEEFIAKVYQKWREERLTDHRLLCLPAA